MSTHDNVCGKKKQLAPKQPAQRIKEVRNGAKRKPHAQNSYEHDNQQPMTSGEMSWDEALHILSPERLEKLRRYFEMYHAEYGKEAEATPQEGGK